jgi:hypothetical protein
MSLRRNNNQAQQQEQQQDNGLSLKTMLAMVPALNKNNFYEWKRKVEVVAYRDDWAAHGDFLMQDEQDIEVVRNNHDYLFAGGVSQAAKLKRKNAFAMLFTTAGEYEYLLEDCPMGHAALAYHLLVNEFERNTVSGMQDLQNDFNNSNMLVDHVPLGQFIMLINQRAKALQRKMGNQAVTDRQKINVLLSGVLPDFGPRVEILQAQDLAGMTYSKVSKSLQDYAAQKKIKDLVSGGQSSIPKAYAMESKDECRNYKKNKQCRFGAKCKYLHDGKAPRDSHKQQRFDGTCNHCGIKGHKEKDCRKKKKDTDQDKSTAVANQLATEVEDDDDVHGYNVETIKMDANYFVDTQHTNTWILDSGTNRFATWDEKDFEPGTIKQVNIKVKAGNGVMTCIKTGTVTKRSLSTGKLLRLSGTLLLPNCRYKLLAESKLEDGGCTIIKKKGRCEVLNKQDQRLMTVDKKGGLYHTDLAGKSSTSGKSSVIRPSGNSDKMKSAIKGTSETAVSNLKSNYGNPSRSDHDWEFNLETCAVEATAEFGKMQLEKHQAVGQLRFGTIEQTQCLLSSQENKVCANYCGARADEEEMTAATSSERRPSKMNNQMQEPGEDKQHSQCAREQITSDTPNTTGESLQGDTQGASFQNISMKRTTPFEKNGQGTCGNSTEEHGFQDLFERVTRVTVTLLIMYFCFARCLIWHLQQTLRYLTGTADYDIAFQAGENFELHAEADEDLAGDKVTSRSTSGHFISLGEYGLISASARKQRKVASSTGQAETYALHDLTKELDWARAALREIGEDVNEPTRVKVDNQGVVKQTTKFANHAAAKHYRIQQAVIRERVSRNEMVVDYVKSEENPADFFTKALHARQFAKHRLTIMGPQSSK